MPVPALNGYGLLPQGIHDCSLDEIRESFGRSPPSRRRLSDALGRYLEEVRSAGLAIAMIVNGSFVTDKPEPGNIDLILVLSRDHDLSAGLRPFEYKVLSRRRVRGHYGFDLLVARETGGELAVYIEFFQQVRGRPELRKGLLRVRP